MAYEIADRTREQPAGHDSRPAGSRWTVLLALPVVTGMTVFVARGLPPGDAESSWRVTPDQAAQFAGIVLPANVSDIKVSGLDWASTAVQIRFQAPRKQVQQFMHENGFIAVPLDCPKPPRSYIRPDVTGWHSEGTTFCMHAQEQLGTLYREVGVDQTDPANPVVLISAFTRG